MRKKIIFLCEKKKNKMDEVSKTISKESTDI